MSRGGAASARTDAARVRVAVMPFTVLRKALLSPTGLARLSAQAAPEIARLRSVIRASRADVVLSNTVTIPWWPVAASAAGVPVLAHVHEAEDTQRRIIRAGLNAPLLAASRIVANSGAARDALLDAQPRLAPRRRARAACQVTRTRLSPNSPKKEHYPRCRFTPSSIPLPSVWGLWPSTGMA